jgi:hypothetical protein
LFWVIHQLNIAGMGGLGGARKMRNAQNTRKNICHNAHNVSPAWSGLVILTRHRRACPAHLVF